MNPTVCFNVSTTIIIIIIFYHSLSLSFHSLSLFFSCSVLQKRNYNNLLYIHFSSMLNSLHSYWILANFYLFIFYLEWNQKWTEFPNYSVPFVDNFIKLLQRNGQIMSSIIWDVYRRRENLMKNKYRLIA